MKPPIDIFQEYVAEVGIKRLAWEANELGNGRWLEETDNITELRRRLFAAGYSGSFVNPLVDKLIADECIRLIAKQ